MYFMRYPKLYLNIDVLEAAKQRINALFDQLDHVYVSFSGGKDSGVLLNLVIEEARARQRLPVHVLIVDMECQFTHTYEYLYRMAMRKEVAVDWVCLPMSLRNSASQFEPKWICWDPEKKSSWVRPFPTLCHPHGQVIQDQNYFPFYFFGMEFEDFVQRYGEWVSEQKQMPVAAIIAIRSDESLNRYNTIKNTHKQTLSKHRWTTRKSPQLVYAYPIYDWKVNDIWAANAQFLWDYNFIYQLMYQAGVPLTQQRLCQPFGDDQRKSLWLYHILEPQTWAKLVERVEGCNFSAKYSKKQGHILGYYRFELPKGHTYKSYSKFLLNTMPPHLAYHYRSRIFQFLNWWRKNGPRFGYTNIPDSANKKLEASKKAPSWRRICKVLIKNDYWCRGLSFSQTQKLTQHYIELYNQYLNRK